VKGLEKKAAVLETCVADWGGDANGEPKNALVLELEEVSECGMDEIEAGEYELSSIGEYDGTVMGLRAEREDWATAC